MPPKKLDDTHDTQDIKISFLEAKKQRLFEIVQELYNHSLKLSDPLVKTKFLARINSLDKTRDEFVETLDNLVLAHLEKDPMSKPNCASLDSFDELYRYIRSAENNIKQEKTVSTNASIRMPKLPPIQLVGFDGSPSKFQLFYENFCSLIHDNPYLSNAEKVQYLVGSLSGTALTFCSGISPTSENYETIWQSLLTKYKDTRVQASQYIDQMLNFKPCQDIDRFIQQFCSAQSALTRLTIPNLADFIMTHIALSKLDKDMVQLFEQNYKDAEIPTFENISTFVEQQSKIRTLRQNTLSKPTGYNNNKNHRGNNTSHAQVKSLVAHSEVSSPKKKCIVCSEPAHALFKCSQFLNLDATSRNEMVYKNRYCKNCLGFHDTGSCKSPKRCSVCGRKHHSLIHVDNFIRRQPGTSAQTSSGDSHDAAGSSSRASDSSPALSPAPNNATSNNVVLHNVTSRVSLNLNAVVIPTAIVHVYSSSGSRLKLRALIDTGSMCNFITKACCERLNFTVKPGNSQVQGIGESESVSCGFATFTIHSRFDNSCSYTITARVINSITDKLPNARVDVTQLHDLNSLPLADNYFDVPGDVDCLLGCEILPNILGGDKVTSSQSSIVGLESTLGYLLMGNATYINNKSWRSRSINADKSFVCAVNDTDSLTQITERFWELDNVPTKIHMSPEDEECEKLFIDSYSRDVTGRFTVRLPFESEPSKLGDSYSTAKRRLFILEKKLNSCPDLRNGYNATIQEYIDKGYLNEVSDFKPSHECYYMPHRAVYRPEKSSSKTRIVVDASCQTTSGKSLNDLLYKGPNLQSNIFELLINLRMFSVALTADIEKMYFQIKLVPEHHPFQRILYRFDSDSKIRIFQFNRVCFGVSASPYLAMRAVRQLATDSQEIWPLAAYEANNNMYMDDYVNSIDGPEKAEQVYREMVQIFKAGGFNLIKWISNDTKLMNKIPLSHKNPQVIDFDDNSASTANTKVVGMQWQPIEDYFQFKINSDIPECSKRTILSVTARLFDPLGLLSPVTTFLRLLVQECWVLGLSWDDPAPPSVKSKWTQFLAELPTLESLRIPRHIGIATNMHIMLIGYADASESCYGCSLYIRVSPNAESGGIVTLLAAKSRVATLKKISLATEIICGTAGFGDSKRRFGGGMTCELHRSTLRQRKSPISSM